MINNIEILNKILTKYKYRENLSVKDQKHIVSAKRKILSNILKSKGTHSMLFAASLRVFLLAKNIGLRITVIQSAVAATIITVTVASGVATGSYLAVKKITAPKADPTIEQEEHSAVPEIRKLNSISSGNMDRGLISSPINETTEKDIPTAKKILITKDTETDATPKQNKMIFQESTAIPVRNNKIKSGTSSNNITAKKTVTNEEIPAQQIIPKEPEKPAIKKDGPHKSEDTEPGTARGRNFKFQISGDMALTIPGNNFRQSAGRGVSGNISIGVKDLFKKNLFIGLESGLALFSGKNSADDGSQVLQVLTVCQYSYALPGRYYIAPGIGAGVAGYRTTNTDKSITEGTGITAALGLNFGYLPYSCMNLFVGTKYYTIRAKENNFGFLCMYLGAGYIF